MEATQFQGLLPAASAKRVRAAFAKNLTGITRIQSRHKNPTIDSTGIPSLFFSPSCASARLKFVRVQSSAAEQSVYQSFEVLPGKLRQIVRLFEPVTDQRAKYNQLMHYAKNLKPLPKEFQTTENKVQGCVSQVWVKADLDSEGKLYFEADSDSILTKGLAALLVEGLSGSTPEEIISLTPDFIQMLGLKQSLTPSRSNGFYNMFRLMQTKAKQLQSDPKKTSALDARTMEVSQADNTTKVTEEVPRITNSMEVASAVERPDSRRSKIEKKLEEALNPAMLEVDDVSHKHAGHAGVRGVQGGETHFNLKIVSKEFEGKTLVKRHRQIYDLLQDELKSGLHALSIVAKTPSEVAGK